MVMVTDKIALVDFTHPEVQDIIVEQGYCRVEMRAI